MTYCSGNWSPKPSVWPSTFRRSNSLGAGRRGRSGGDGKKPEEDQVKVRDESIDDEYREGQRSRIENAELDNDIGEFVDVVNSRNLEALSELLAPEADAKFLAARSREEVTDGFGEIFS